MRVVSERQTDSVARDSIKIVKQRGGAKERGRLRGDAHIARMPSLLPWPSCTPMRLIIMKKGQTWGTMTAYKTRGAKRVNLKVTGSKKINGLFLWGL
jgi:hypothetical protein